jgi:hypothetical protein
MIETCHGISDQRKRTSSGGQNDQNDERGKEQSYNGFLGEFSFVIDAGFGASFQQYRIVFTLIHRPNGRDQLDAGVAVKRRYCDKEAPSRIVEQPPEMPRLTSVAVSSARVRNSFLSPRMQSGFLKNYATRIGVRGRMPRNITAVCI